MKSKILKYSLLFLGSSLYATEMLLPSKVYGLAVKNSNELQSSLYQLKAKEIKLNEISGRFKPKVDLTVSHNKTYYEINHLQKRADYSVNEASTDITLALKQTLYDKEIDNNLISEKFRIKLLKSEFELEKEKLIKEIFPIYISIK